MAHHNPPIVPRKFYHSELPTGSGTERRTEFAERRERPAESPRILNLAVGGALNKLRDLGVLPKEGEARPRLTMFPPF